MNEGHNSTPSSLVSRFFIELLLMNWHIHIEIYLLYSFRKLMKKEKLKYFIKISGEICLNSF